MSASGRETFWMSGCGREALADVREWLGDLLDVQEWSEELLNVREWSEGPPG